MQAWGTRRMDAERAEFAARAVGIVRDAGERYDALAHAQAMRRLDSLFDEFYGRAPGDPAARFLRAITEGTAQARRQAVSEDAAATRRLVRRHAGALRRAADG